MHRFTIARSLGVTSFLLLLMGAAFAQSAATYEALDHIREAAMSAARPHVSAAAELSTGRLDERLRLTACPAPLSAQVMSTSAAALSVEVRCDAAGWKLFVPVSVREQVPVLVATRALTRGQLVSASDVQVQTRERAGLGPAWLGSPEQIDGQVMQRPVPAGTVLTPALLAPARVVRRGQSVTLIGASGGFQVRAQGKALADAASGESVAVENLSSRRVVQGLVQADGTVRVSL
ncbi:MAG: flagellar basal body P-ring formation chaperone FlgA [Panacagrimonas sp.]